jgi:parvulin-like peptidyl-prolyl isomerase
MTKRSQTGGLPEAGGDKTPAKTTPARYNQPLRERQSRAEREAKTQRLIVLGTIIVAVVVALLLAIALVIEFVVTPGQAVATVNGENITVAQYQQRVRLERAIINERLYGLIEEARPFGDQATQYLQLRLGQEPYATWYNEIQVGDVIGNRVLNDMVNEKLIEQQANELGITVTDADIEAEIDQYFEFVPLTEPTDAEATAEPATATPTPFVSPTPSPEPTATEVVATEEATEAPADAEPTATFVPTQTPVPTLNATERADQYATSKEQAFANIASNAGVSREDVRAYFAREALRAKVAAEMTAETVSGMDSEVQVRHILVATEQEALDLLAALEAGESFTELARAVSLDTGSAANGGEYDWSPASGYVGPFADAVRDAEIGEFYGPVQTEFGYHIIQVRGRRDVPMTTAQLNQARDTAFSTIVTELRTAASNQIQTYPVWADVVPSEPAFVPRL